MNPDTFRVPVKFAVTIANASILRTDFSRAARAAGWSETEIEEVVAHQLFTDTDYLKCTLAANSAWHLTGE